MANFDYIASVKCVNGVDTWIEFLFPNYVGILANDIEAINIKSPSVTLTNDINDFDIWEDENDVLYQIIGDVPELGTYIFHVTIDKEEVMKEDWQTVNRTLPLVLSEGRLPAASAIVSAGNINFEWDTVTHQIYDTYYGIQVRNSLGEYVVNERHVPGYTNSEVLSAGNYTWQVMVMDGINWKYNNNRTHGNWHDFTVI